MSRTKETLHIPDHLRGNDKQKVPAYIENSRPKSILRLLFRLTVFFGMTGFVMGSCGGMAIFARYATGIPHLNSLNQYRPPLPTVVYSHGEDVIGEFSAERRVLVPLEKIPKKLLYAFVAAEDDRFFKHGGVDPLGIMRAVVKNLKAGRIKAGGSTLTQQVAKTFLLDRLVIKMRDGLCRSDKQCGWRQRCKTRAGRPYGRCVKRSFRACSKQVTVIYQGKPTKVYRGYTTMCDPHEVCRPQCKDKVENQAGLCPQWMCVPAAPKPTCQTSQSCRFGERCTDGECKPSFQAQIADILDKLAQKGAEVHRVKAPEKILSELRGDFKRKTQKYVEINARQAARINKQKIERLPGVRVVYRFAEKSFKRKIREAILATQLERKFTKGQILWLYLNHIYLGHHAHGVQAAAQNYFGKNVWELTLAECALLAGLPKKPSRADPYRYPDRARTRMTYVLKRMHEMGYISKAEREQALNEPIKTKAIPNLFFEKTPYFTEEVRKQLLSTYGKEGLLKGGMEVYTSIDTEKQMLGRRALRKGLKNLDIRQGYRGPLGVIPKQHWSKALDKAAKFYGPGPLKPKMIYAGLVTRINRRKQQVTVKVGHHIGILPLAGMRWARKPNPYRSYKGNMIRRIGKTLRPGYWILVEPVKSWKDLRTRSRVYDRTIPRRGLLFRLRQHPKVEGALVSIDPHSGYIETLIGGYAYKRSQFNRALYACRQPGSSFKPIVYTTALENGYTRKVRGKDVHEPITPGSILQDTPLVYDSGTDPTAARYKPSNYSGRYEGDMLLRTALMKSKNIPSIRLMMKVTMDKVIEYARKFGLTTELRKDLGLALGQSCAKPWEMAMFYAMLARGGLKVNPVFIKMVINRDGEVVEDQRSYDDPSLSPESQINRFEDALLREEKRLISRQTAYLITTILRQVVLYGTGVAVRKLKKPAAGKTGTTNDSFDVWFTGFTPLHATVAWLGFDKNESPLGSWETGGQTAAPVWVEYMKGATKGLKWKEFQAPPGIVWRRIDPKTGKLANVDTSGAIRLPFKAGTEPKDRVNKRGQVKADDFYKEM